MFRNAFGVGKGRLTNQEHFLFTTQLSTNTLSRIVLFVPSALMVMFCYVFQPCYLVLMTYHFIRENKIDLNFSTKYVSCLSACATYCLWFFKKNILVELNQAVANHIKTFHENEDRKKGMPRASLYVLYATATFVFSVLIMYFTSKLENNPYDPERDAWVETLSFGTMNASLYNQTYKQDIMTWDSLLYTAGTVGSGTLIPIVFVFHCNTFNCYLDKAKEIVADKLNTARDPTHPDRTLDRREVIYLRKLFKSTKDIIGLCDQIYSAVFFMWYGVSLIALCQGTTEIIKEGVSNLNVLKFSMYFAIYGQTFIWISAVSFSSSKMPEKLASSRRLIEELTMYYTDMPCKVYGEINILLHQLNSDPKGITVGGCVLVTKSFFLSYMGVVLTYIILVIQISPSFKTL